jgi:hypothetical protein
VTVPMFQESAHIGKATPDVPLLGALTLFNTLVTIGLVDADDPLAVMFAGVLLKAGMATMIQ